MRANHDRSEAVRRIVHPREIDLGGFIVRRALPTPGIRSVGPWVFFDHMGPFAFPRGKGVDVKPHPHINLATVTYLFEGEIVHRDSTGCVQPIKPGAVNLMFAAGGIVHSERTGPELRSAGHRMNGLQLWIALPEEFEESDPAFYHYPAEDLPQADINGVRVRVMMGGAFGLESKVKTFSPTLYAEADIPNGRILDLPDTVGDRAVYLISGSLHHPGGELPTNTLIIFEPGTEVRITARADSRIVIIGGNSLGRRYMWWNFVSSSKERIEQAKGDWREGRFKMVPGETEFYPLPDADVFSEREESNNP